MGPMNNQCIVLAIGAISSEIYKYPAYFTSNIYFKNRMKISTIGVIGFLASSAAAKYIGNSGYWKTTIVKRIPRFSSSITN